jgi:mannose-6-phosphate isomerase-like protein (cupin superfamily)
MAEDGFAGAHIPPGAGEAYWVGGEPITFKVRGAQTGGAVALVENEVQPGYGPPPHLHLHENEAFYVVAGEFKFTLGDRTVEAPPGSLLTVPQGQLHTFRNVGAAPGRLVAMIWPAVAFEGFVQEVGTREPATGPPDLEKLLAAAAKFGIAVPPPQQGGA